ncbi:MAG: hypothetical protein M1346_00645 [Gammaproteobacteria bacterium]|nr:hypothetical protein [Gammaproteobacteria bacterium]
MAADPGLQIPAPLEAVYPRDARQAGAWAGRRVTEAVQEPVDFTTLFTIAQVDPNFRAMIGGTDEGLLWWTHGLSAAQWAGWRRAWAASPLSRHGLLFLGGTGAPADLPRLSAWQRAPLPAGAVVVADDDRWYPALSAGAQAVHLQNASPMLQWQVYAGSRPISVSPGVTLNAAEPLDADTILTLEKPAQILDHWQALRGDAMAARQRGDATRRIFWQERRHAGERLPEFLQRVFDW